MTNSKKKGFKFAGYILIPIFVLAAVFSAISIYFGSKNIEIQKQESFFDTEDFSELYDSYISKNFNAHIGSIVKQDASENSEYYYNNYYGSFFDYQENVKIGDNIGRINYIRYETTNFNFLLVDYKNNVAYTNLNHTMATDSIEKAINKICNNKIYWNYNKGQIDTSIERLSLENIRYKPTYERLADYDCAMYTAIDDKLEYYDEIKTDTILVNITKTTYMPSFFILPISIILIIVCSIICLNCIVLYDKDGNVILDFVDKVPLGIAGMITVLIMVTSAIGFSLADSGTSVQGIVGIGIGLIIVYIGCIFTLETLMKRIKTKTLWKNTIVYRLYKWLKETIGGFLYNRSWSFRFVAVVLALILVSTILLSIGTVTAFICIGLWIYIIYKIYERISKFHELERALEKIYKGDTSEVHLNENNYPKELRKVAIYINDIAGGFSNAIEENLKSERLKTELITNVSHDIKTPLTSIINYVDLLKKEEMPNEKTKQYLDILDNKSQRLKKLTEDLVEASKASSGNIKLNMEKLDVKELISQISGEFEDKFKKKKLTTVISMPDEDISIMADSRYLYRVFENLYSNISKYALENSRVYLDIVRENEKVKIDIKNISKDKLNISPDELMQRFVRGEASRNTEGSGLGLSIAESLTTLQNGSFNIYLDGDLFKVTVEFDIVK